MPYLNVKLGAPASPDTADAVAAFLTGLTADVLGKKPELTAIGIDFIAPSQWYIGGRSIAEQSLRSFYLDIKITEGTNTKDEKALYAARAFAGVEAIVGTVAPASYVVIQETRADAWGYEGQTQEFRYVRGRPM